MLRNHWLQSPITIKPTSAAHQRVWLAVVEAAQPTGIEKLLRGLVWLFATPVRTAAFVVCLFVMVWGGGYVIPARLEHRQFVQFAADLDQELPGLEQELSADLPL